MKNSILILFLSLIVLTGFSNIITITNAGNTFNPSSITISYGDSILFKLGYTHSVTEVSESMWEADEASPLLEGFNLPLGGGLLTPAALSEGIHYYVCASHVTMGMKGRIFVLGPTYVAQHIPQVQFSLFPNPTQDQLSIKVSNDLIGTTFFIWNSAGQLMLTGQLEHDVHQISVKSLERGIYFLQSRSAPAILHRFIKN
jgi:plastocyanin